MDILITQDQLNDTVRDLAFVQQRLLEVSAYIAQQPVDIEQLEQQSMVQQLIIEQIGSLTTVVNNLVPPVMKGALNV